MPRLPIPLAALAALILLSAAPAAEAAPRKAPRVPTVVERTFVLEEATANREVEWHYLDSETKDRCATWVDASGLERTVVSLARPARYTLVAAGRRVALSPVAAVRFEGQVTRRADWDPHAPECATCGGELGACTGRAAEPPLAPLVRPDCGTRRLRAPQLHVVMVPKGGASPGDDDLAPLVPDAAHVNVDVVPNAPAFATCPPTQAGGPGLPRREGLGVRFTGEYRELLRARPGATVRLKGRVRIGHVVPLGDWTGGAFTKPGTCPALSGPGRQVCDTLYVEATFRRVA